MKNYFRKLIYRGISFLSFPMKKVGKNLCFIVVRVAQRSGGIPDRQSAHACACSEPSNATTRVYGHRGQGERDAARVGILNRAAVFRSAPPPVPLTALCDCANGSNCVCHLTFQ